MTSATGALFIIIVAAILGPAADEERPPSADDELEAIRELMEGAERSLGRVVETESEADLEPAIEEQAEVVERLDALIRERTPPPAPAPTATGSHRSPRAERGGETEAAPDERPRAARRPSAPRDRARSNETDEPRAPDDADGRGSVDHGTGQWAPRLPRRLRGDLDAATPTPVPERYRAAVERYIRALAR